jgi:hypothetical protein
MRRSNSKEARRAVEAYVLEEIEAVNERMEQEHTHRPVSAAFDTLKDEMSYQSDYADNRAILGTGLAAKYRKAGRYGFVAATTPYWVWVLACKAGCFTIDYYSQRQLLAAWLDETPEEADKYSNDDVLRRYCHLTAQAFERLYDRENTPHRIPTSDFKAIYQERNGGHFFDRKTMRFFGQTMRDISVYGFEFVADYDGTTHDCYRVESRGNIDGYRFSHTHYFNRDTLAEIHPAEEA